MNDNIRSQPAAAPPEIQQERPGGVALEARDISKRFGGQVALSNVSLSLEAGETHGIIGENGAGKSTLISILAGITTPDEGALRMDGQEVIFRNAAEARQHGIMVVHQEPLIFRDLTVAENVILANARWRSALCNRRGIERFAQKSFSELGIGLDPSAEAGALTAGEGALVEIARAMDQEARVVIFDEPTSALSAQEAELVNNTIRRLAATGIAVVLISHRLGEVFELSDTVTVLRNGRRIATRPAGDITQREAVTLMLGAPPKPIHQDTAGSTGQVLLRCVDVCTERAQNVSFELRAGEVVGLAGLRGAGQSSIADAVAGIGRVVSGRIELDGAAGGRKTNRGAPLAYLPEDRQRDGLFPWFSIARNISIGVLNQARWWSRPKSQWQTQLAETWISRLDIRPADSNAPVAALSGGNQQKVLLARCLAKEPVVLVLNNPGRGVDVGAKAEIYATVERLRAEGLGFLLVSDDVEEMAILGTVFHIFRNGRIAGSISPPAGPDDIAMAISGQE